MPLLTRWLRVLALSTGLLPTLASPALAQTFPVSAPPIADFSPRLLLKSGLRLTHLFYLPDARSWQLLLSLSFGPGYRLSTRLSAHVQAEADISAGRAARGRRGSPLLPTPSTGVSLGARYYFNQPNPAPSLRETT